MVERSHSRNAKGLPRRLLVAGAGGFLGREVVRAFASDGWQVRGLIRSAAYGDRVRSAGGEPVLGDVLDPTTLGAWSEGCDAIVHVAANPSGAERRPDLARAVRVQGTANLVAAARFSRVRRLVVGSGYWVYAGQPGLITEESPVDPQGESRINYDAERVGLAANVPSELEVVVVRPGMVYGDGAWFRPVMEGIGAGTYRVIDGGTNRWSFVSLPDTARGFLAATVRGAAGQVYNLVDGSPAPWAEFVGFLAERLGRHAPASESFASAVERYGPTVAAHLRANRATSASKLMALGWEPEHPDFRRGLEALLTLIEDREPGSPSPR